MPRVTLWRNYTSTEREKERESERACAKQHLYTTSRHITLQHANAWLMHAEEDSVAELHLCTEKEHGVKTWSRIDEQSVLAVCGKHCGASQASSQKGAAP